MSKFHSLLGDRKARGTIHKGKRTLETKAKRSKRVVAKPKRAIIIDVSAGGTSWGQSFWRAVGWGCARRAVLGRNRHGLPDTDVLQIGVLSHGLMEYALTHNNWTFDLNRVTFQPEPREECEILAKRSFDAARISLPMKKLFGKPLAVEVGFPKTQAQAVRLRANIGIPHITMRNDLVTKLSKRNCDAMATYFNTHIEPGNYVCDWKFVASPTAWTAEGYYYDIQPQLYAHMWNLCNPRQPVKGTLMFLLQRMAKDTTVFRSFAIKARDLDSNYAVQLAALVDACRTKTNNFDVTMLPAHPTKKSNLALYEHLHMLPNFDRCRDYGKLCQFGVDRTCTR